MAAARRYTDAGGPEHGAFPPARQQQRPAGRILSVCRLDRTAGFTQIDPEISLYFHNVPLPRPYTVQWTGKVYAPTAGVYRFATESIDQSQVMINNQLIVNNRGSTTSEGNANLVQGWNDIVVRFSFHHTSHTHIYLYWTPPNGQRETVPSRYLSPPMGRYPTDAEVAAQPNPLPGSGQPNNAPSTIPGSLPTPAPAGLMNMSPVRTIGEPGSGEGNSTSRMGLPLALRVVSTLLTVATGAYRHLVLTAHFCFPWAAARINSSTRLISSRLRQATLSCWIRTWAGYTFSIRTANPPDASAADAQFYHPRGLSIDAQDNLYIADTGGSRVVKMSLQGTKLQVFGSRGTGRGQFIEPTDAAPDSSGYIFATDVPNKRILSFTADGRFVLDFPIPLAGLVNGPHIAIAPDQTLLVTVPEQHKVQRLSRNGNLLGEWGDPGWRTDHARQPTGITIDGNNVWIADTGNNRIELWHIQ